MAQPRSPEDIFADFIQRRSGLLQALTDDAEDFFDQCDPNSENLVAYLGRDTGILQGHSDGTWSVALPAEEVPPELPEPCLGINFARDGMVRKDWLALVAVHSDAWLISVAFYYGAKLDNAARLKLFRSINTMSTLYEIIMGRASRPNKVNSHSKRRRADTVQQGNGAGEAQAADAPLPTGRLLTYADITPALKGRQAELYWPDDKMWYLIEVYAINIRSRIAKIQYTSGEFEDLDLDEIIREGHMSLICQ